MQNMKLRWLHVSDLHFDTKDRFDRDRITSSLLELVEKERNKSPFDMVFVTGDIAYSGKAEEYEIANEFFEKLFKSASLPACEFS